MNRANQVGRTVRMIDSGLLGTIRRVHKHMKGVANLYAIAVGDKAEFDDYTDLYSRTEFATSRLTGVNNGR